METLRSLTDNINVVVRFFQSVNCLFWQLQWLERNILQGSNERICITLLIVILIGYMTFSCSSNDGTTVGYLCGENGVSMLVLITVIGVIVYYLYKRYLLSQDTSSTDNDHEEREKFVPASVPPFEQIEMGRPISVARPYRA